MPRRVGYFRARGLHLSRIEPLELRRLMSAVPPADPGYQDFGQPASVEVVNRSLFYNNSIYDGKNAAANAADDGAIATDKTAMLPGLSQGFANVSNYVRGINGIMVDIAGSHPNISAADFTFKIGNNNAPETWATAPRPVNVLVRAGAGYDGSDRVHLVWVDGAIQQTWLQVTVLANARTGLSTPDVFYFGSAIAESGNMEDVGFVTNVTDEIAARNNAGWNKPITNAYDFDRDGRVDATDQVFARTYASLPGASLKNVSIASALVPQAAADFSREQPDLFNPGDAGITTFNIPAIVATRNGTLLAFAEGRWANVDASGYAILMRRSTDDGATWSSISTVYKIPLYADDWIGNPAPVVDATTGKVFLLFTRNNSSVLVTQSTNDGLSWLAPIDITRQVKVTATFNPNPASFPSTAWGWYATGPGHGIQLQNGPYAGRLIVAADHRLESTTSGPSWSHVIYSDNHGLTWKLGGGLDQNLAANRNSNEASLIELNNGDLYMSIRVVDSSIYNRYYSRSSDGGATWSTMQKEPNIRTMSVEGSLLRLNDDVVLFSAPEITDNTRRSMTIWGSFDDTQTWVKLKTIFFGYSGYSDLVQSGPNTALLMYTRGFVPGANQAFQKIALARFDLKWLLSSTPVQFSWYFNEAAPGQAANTAGTSIQDYGPWDQRAQALSSDTPPMYVAGATPGSSALRLTHGSDLVQLTRPITDALQFNIQDNFTVEMRLRTLDAAGVLIGTRAGQRGWSVRLLNGGIQLFLDDGTRTAEIHSAAGSINDGTWHQVVFTREGKDRKLMLYVDGKPVSAPLTDWTQATLQNNEPLMLGGYSDGTQQVAFDIDLLRITRALLTPAEFLPLAFIKPRPMTEVAYAADAPTSIFGLKLWLPPYDYTRNFTDANLADPVTVLPAPGNAVGSALAVSGAVAPWKLVTSVPSRALRYAEDNTMGPYWNHIATSSTSGMEWTVQNSNGTTGNNFDFVQNTGKFTLSAFIKPAAGFNTQMTIFDTNAAASSNPGFSLYLQPDGHLALMITGSGGQVRFMSTVPGAPIATDVWYHIAVVGNGPLSPVTFYITAVGDDDVNAIVSSRTISGANGSYPTDALHNLQIGSRAFTDQAAFNGGMVNQAIYNRALSAAEIQKLYDFGTR